MVCGNNEKTENEKIGRGIQKKKKEEMFRFKSIHKITDLLNKNEK